MNHKYWDIVIVGAGIVGCSTAFHLKNRHPDKKILLVDKYSMAGQGTTGKSNACYRNVFSTDVNIALCESSINFYKYMEKKHNLNFNIMEFGYLWLLSEEQYRNNFDIEVNSKSYLQYYTDHNIEYEILDNEEISRRIPHLKAKFIENNVIPIKDIEYALFAKQCGSFEPDLIIKMYLDGFREKGGSIKFDTHVKDVLYREKGKKFDRDYFTSVWSQSEIAGIITQDEELLCDNLILTTGAWINQILNKIGINSTIKAKKRQLLRICNVSELVFNKYFSSINSIPFIILPVAGIFIKPIPNANCIEVGCSDDINRIFEIDSFDNNSFDNPLGEQEFYHINVLPVLEEYFPDLFNGDIKIEKPSAGMQAISPDKMPIIERIDKLGNLYYASGSSGSGIMKADAIGRIVSSLVAGEEFCTLFDNYKIKVSNFSIENRDLEREGLSL